MIRRTAIAAVLASVTSLVAAASGTAPCAIVRNLFLNGNPIPAATAMACLSSVPFDPDVGIATVQNFQKFSQFQSTIGDLKNPGVGYANAPVDIMDLLDKTITLIEDGSFTNQYQFEEHLALIVGLAFDGHYTFLGNTFLGAINWYRGGASDGEYEGSLISVSLDGAQLPQIYFTADLTNSQASPIVQIDGEDVVAYLTRQAEHQLFHDPDARWNTLFARQQSDSVGAFVMPWFYPGANFTVTFANGKSKTIQNYAVISSTLSEEWSQVVDGESFYNTFVVPQTSSSGKSVKKRTVPPNYPLPVIQHGDKEVELGAFFLGDYGLSEVAVLSMNTFEPVASGDATEFQDIVDKFIKFAKSKGRTKLVIDVSSNGGGSLFLGYDIFKQFFPSIEPNIGSRMRYSTALDILGSAFGTITLKDAQEGRFNSSGMNAADMYLSPIHYSTSVDVDQEDFTSWRDMAGPVTINGSPYTQIMRYNFSDPLLYLGDSIESVTGYGPLANVKSQPYAAQDIILLHDGYCASTCAIFSDLMHRLGGVRTVVLGGRPQFGPMQSVGGTKGSLMEPWSAIKGSVEAVLAEFGTTEQKKKWEAILPGEFPITFTNPPSVNFRNAYHPRSDTPMQFLNETANCRLFYTPAMLRNVTAVWDTVARLAWGYGGGTGQTCVRGGMTDGKPIGESKGTVGKTVTPNTDSIEGGGSDSTSITGSGSGSAQDQADVTVGHNAGGVAQPLSWGVLGAMAVLSMVVLQI